jgi:hypothetical protein
MTNHREFVITRSLPSSTRGGREAVAPVSPCGAANDSCGPRRLSCFRVYYGEVGKSNVFRGTIRTVWPNYPNFTAPTAVIWRTVTEPLSTGWPWTRASPARTADRTEAGRDVPFAGPKARAPYLEAGLQSQILLALAFLRRRYDARELLLLRRRVWSIRWKLGCEIRLPLIERAAAVFRLCGDWKQGIARVRCPDCTYDFFVPFSCKSFHLCPSCAQKRTLLLGEYLSEDLLLQLPHRQFVFSIPKCLRVCI